MKRILSLSLGLLSVSCLVFAFYPPLEAQIPSPPPPSTSAVPCTGGGGAAVQPPFENNYTCVSLGSVAGVPTNYGGLTLKYNDTNTLIIGGFSNNSAGRLYQIGVTRDSDMHITGFIGTATQYPAVGATVGQNNDGGVVFGPSNVLFATRYSQNELEETKPGSTAPDKVISLSNIVGGGVSPSVGSIGFVPGGFPGAGKMKLVSYNSGGFFTAAFAPDGNGTYDITSVTAGPVVGGGPEGIVFVPSGSPVFPANSMLIVQYGAGAVVTAPVDANGDPILANLQSFITGLAGAEGAFIDPVTGDFLFSTFGGANQVIRVSGFAPAPVPISAVSRKTHGATGVFDIDLLPPALGIECRTGTPGGKDFTVIVTFANTVSVTGASVISGDSMAMADPPTVSGATVTVNLHNVSNIQRMTVTLANVNDTIRTGNVSIPMAILQGDGNGDGAVNTGDTTQTRTRSGQGTDATNFRFDVNTDGVVNGGDAIVVRTRSGTGLP